MSDTRRSAFLIGIFSFAGVFVLLVLLYGFFFAIDFFEKLGVEEDGKMAVFWRNNLADFNELAENCDWKKDKETYEYAAATPECLDLSKKLNFKPMQFEGSETVVLNRNLFKGYVYSKKELLPLHQDLDSIPDAKIPPYACVYRKLDQNWYIERCNPYD